VQIAVVGAGAIGGWVAGRLALAGNRVMALASGGSLARVEIEEGGVSQSAEFVQFDGTADVLIIAVKAPSLARAAEAARPLIGPGTLIVPLLNGVPWWFSDEPLSSVDPDSRIAHALPAAQVVGTVVHAASHRSAPGHVVVTHADKILIGEPEGDDSERLARLFALLDHAGLKPDMTGNIRRAIWYKLWGNATINPLSALTRSTADKLLADPPIRTFMLEAMTELAEVGAAIGCPISESGEDRMAVTARLGAFKPSMLQDVEAGRPIELEALVGAPREIARRHDIATPQLDRIYTETRQLAVDLKLL
jgi:2-dehydropantoate 2-reductase